MNLYREDDYVGQGLDDVTDKKITGTGHEGYWTDTSVLKELETLLLRKDQLPKAAVQPGKL